MSENGYERQDGVSYSYRDTAAYQQQQDRPSPPQETPPDQSTQQLFQLPSERFAQERSAAPALQVDASPAQPMGAPGLVTVDLTLENVDEYLAYRRICDDRAADSELTVTVEMPAWDADNFPKYQTDMSSDADAPLTAEWEPPSDDESSSHPFRTMAKRLLPFAIGFAAIDALMIFLIRTTT